MNLMSSSLLRLTALTVGFVPSLLDMPHSQEGNAGSTDLSNSFIDTVCTLPYLNEINITNVDHPLVVKSKEAILSTGISDSYFNEHFTLLCAVDNYQGGHRLVRWQYSVGEYTTIIKDNIGTIQYDLKGLREIKKVISLKKAERKMRRCIGEFKEAVVFLGHTPSDDKQTKLFLVARSVKEVRGLDITWDVGFVDLESGKCTKLQGRIIHAPLGPKPKDSGR